MLGRPAEFLSLMSSILFLFLHSCAWSVGPAQSDGEERQTHTVFIKARSFRPIKHSISHIRALFSIRGKKIDSRSQIVERTFVSFFSFLHPVWRASLSSGCWSPSSIYAFIPCRGMPLFLSRRLECCDDRKQWTNQGKRIECFFSLAEGAKWIHFPWLRNLKAQITYVY